jgi:hypothetical protein
MEPVPKDSNRWESLVKRSVRRPVVLSRRCFRAAELPDHARGQRRALEQTFRNCRRCDETDGASAKTGFFRRSAFAEDGGRSSRGGGNRGQHCNPEAAEFARPTALGLVS